MSNTAKFEVPDSGDNGKAYVYSSGSDSHVLTDLATQAELDAHTGDTTSVHGIADTSALLTKLWAQANAAGQAVELGDGTRAVAIWAEFIGSQSRRRPGRVAVNPSVQRRIWRAVTVPRSVSTRPGP